MKIAVGSRSELKIRSVEVSLKDLKMTAEILPVETDSGVPMQPFGYHEVVTGARNRAKAALEATGADLSIGIENGIIEIKELNQSFDLPCVCVLNQKGEESFAFGSGYFVPDWVVNEIKSKHTGYGLIIQEMSPGAEKDPIAYYSDNLVKREGLLSQAISCALVKVIDKERYLDSRAK